MLHKDLDNSQACSKDSVLEQNQEFRRYPFSEGRFEARDSRLGSGVFYKV